MSDLSKNVLAAFSAMQKEGNYLPSAAEVSKEAGATVRESEDPAVKQKLQEDAIREKQASHVRMVKVGLLALLTAGDSCQAVDRCRHGRK